MSAENEKVVSDFCKTWTRMNLEEILAFMTDDAVYHNIPMEPLKGKDAIRKALEGFKGMMEGIEFQIHHTASTGNLVMNERTDTMVMRDGKKVAIPVAGVFELRDGKISAWRDYFDMKMAGMG
jgi:limonene-1,2-epoxide hydrolase